MKAPLLVALALASTLAAQDRMQWFREARFGMFIHWGLYAIPAGAWEGKTNHAEWIRTTAKIPIERYEQFQKEFNPVKFDAGAWADLAKEAGVRYVVITSKHHDGFCLWDSALTDWDVMKTPFQRDILKELSTAVRARGMQMCWYHSIMDWHHPDYLPRRDWEKGTRSAEGAEFPRFVGYLHGQIEELLTKYGPIGILWFDGEWESTWSHSLGKPLYELCRRLQPSVIVNNRVDVGRSGMAGMTKGGEYCGDYGTPEQEVPATGFPGVDWESCMTMNANWGYNAADRHWKSTTELVRMLVDVCSKGGNLLLNIGPKADGTFPDEAIVRLKEIGVWMRANSASIYATQASPFERLAWGRCTMQRAGADTRLYLHVFDWPADGRLVVPGLGNEAKAAKLLAGGAECATTREGASVVITLPSAARDPIDTVVVLDVAGEPIVYRKPELTAAAPIFVDALDVLVRSHAQVEVRYTTDGSNPSDASPLAKQSVRLGATTTLKACAFHEGKPVSDVVAATFTKVAPRQGLTLDNLEPGLRYSVKKGTFAKCPDLPDDGAWIPCEQVALHGELKAEHVAGRFAGFVRIEADGVYEWELSSDDGSRLTIGDQLVIDHDGPHSATSKRGFIALGKGLHVLRVDWFNATGGMELKLAMGRAGTELKPLPVSALLRGK